MKFTSCLVLVSATAMLWAGCSSAPTTSGDNAAAVVPTVLPVTVGKDAAANGKAMMDTLAKARDAKADKTYVVLLPAGTYDLGSQTVAINPYVTLMGSGETTVLTGTGSPLIAVSHNSALGFALVQVANASSPVAQAISMSGGKMFRVHAKIGSTNSAVRFMYAVHAQADAELTDVTAEATAGPGVGGTEGQVAGIYVGVSDEEDGVKMHNVTATANGGDYLSTGISFDQKAAGSLYDVTANGPVKAAVEGEQPFAIYCLIGCKVTMNDSVARAQYALFEGDTATHTNFITGARSTFYGLVSFKNVNCAGGTMADSDTTHCF